MNEFARGVIYGMVFSAFMLFACNSSAATPILLGTANTVTFRGEVTDESVKQVTLDVYKLVEARGSKDYPIYLVLDTPGGSIDAGEALIESIKSVRNLKTITLFAASMGSAIVQALPGERLMVDSGVLMFHRAKGSVSGQFETGELETRLDFYKRFVRRMEQRNADRMNMSLADYKTKIKDELWLTSSESIALGAADRTVSIQCTEALLAKTEHMSVEFLIFKIELDFSGCPLIRTPTVSPGQSEESLEAYNKLRGA